MKDIKFKIASWLIVVVGVLGFIPGFLPFRTAKIIVVELMISAGIALWLIKNTWLKLFLLWCVLRVALGINQYSILTLHLLVIAFVFYQLLSDKLNKGRLVHILNTLCVVAIIQSLMVIWQRCGLWWVILPVGYQDLHSVVFNKNTIYPLFVFTEGVKINITGFLGDTNTGSALLAMCLPTFFRKKWFIFIPLIFIALLFMHALTGIIASAIIATIFLVYKYGKKALLFIVPTLVILGVVILKFDALGGFSQRLEVWQFYLTHLIPKRPIIGWGLGQAEFLWPIINYETSIKSLAFYHSHNEFITLVAELGLIGAFLAGGYVVSTLRSIKDIILKCGFVACLLVCIPIFALHSAIGLIFIVWMALIEFARTSNSKLAPIL